MIEGWKQTTLGEVAEIYGGFAFKGEHFSETQGFPVVKITDIKPPYVDTESCQKIDISQYDKKRIEKFLLRKGNYLVAMTGATIGKVGKITSDIEAYLNQRVAKIDSIDGLSDKDFIYYLVFSENFTKFIQGFSSGSSVQQNISSTDIGKYEILLPPLSEQKAIAAVLSSFDDKIELLRRQNKTLEAIAQAIFKEWFVKFKVKGEQLKLNPKTGLPEGWRRGKLGEMVSHIKDNVIPFKHDNQLYLHYSIPAFDAGKKPTLELGGKILSNKYSVKSFSFLISKLNPSISRIWTIFHAEENSVCSTEFQVVMPRERNNFSFVHCFLNSGYFTKEFASKAHGTSGSHQRANPEDIINMEIIIPRADVNDDFHGTIFPLLTKVNNNNSQIQTLSKLRDTLLPKLMKGEIRVKL